MSWCFGLALGGVVLLNGVELPPEALDGLDLRGVDLRVDALGTLHVTAPGYAWTRDHLVVADPSSFTPSTTWVVLAEDVGSVGMEIAVHVGDVRVKRVASGMGAVVVDVDQLLQPGHNELRVSVTSDNRASGRMAVTVARATRREGVLVLDGEPSRYLVHAAQRGDLTFSLDR